jgi:hypothetical protein
MKRNKTSFLRVLPLLLGVVMAMQANAHAQSVSIVSETDVTESIKAELEVVADTTAAYFKTKFSLELRVRPTVILTADRKAYAAAQGRAFGIARVEADRRAAISRAWTSGSTILMNIGSMESGYVRTRLLSHELVHQYQDLACGGASLHCRSITWIREAVADIIAVRIMEKMGIHSAAQYREDRRKDLAAAGAYPSLTELATDWNAAVSKYPPGPVYWVADMVGFDLVDRRGWESVFSLFVKLKDRELKDAFADIFGVPLDEYVSGFSPDTVR